MPRPLHLVLSAVATVTLLAAAEAEVLNLREAPFSAAGDGATDDRAALMRALGSLEAGDTLLVPPGEYRIVLAKGQIAVPAGVTLLGQGGRSKFVLATDGGPREYREFLRLRSGVTLEGLTIERGESFPVVLLPLFGDVQDVTLRGGTIDGRAERFPEAYCHAIQVGVGSLKNLVLRGMTIRQCNYGLFQANPATGRVDGVTVEDSRFERNTASDLEFNAPRGQMQNVVVRSCSFRDNRCKSPGAGFAVGLANVKTARVENCRIENYGSEALHVEDRSTDVLLAGNTIVAGSTRQPNGVVMVLSSSKKVRIERNFIDARPNENGPHLILVTAGGDRFANPSEVSVTGNVLLGGQATRPWYLQPGSGPAPSGNVVVPADRAGSPAPD